MRSRLLAGLLVASFVLAGCGGSDDSGVSDLSAKKILAETKKQTAKKTVTVTGNASSSGTSVAVDLGFVGDDSTGSITVNGTKLTLLGVDGKTYFKGDTSFYQSLGTSGDTIAKAVGDKWIVAAVDDTNFGSITQFASRDEFFKQLLSPDSELAKTSGKKIDGVETVGLKSKTGTLYVAKDDGRPISLPGKDAGQSLSFDYDKIDAPEAPAASDVVDLNNLAG